ncbi:L-threonylcarbamoyladenylate synthase [Kineococcus sp. NUM-3379]
MKPRYDCTDPDARRRGLSAAHSAVQRGELVVLPTDTVYGIGADAFSPTAVQRLLDAKGRGRSMPPPVLVPDVRTLDGLATAVPFAVRELVDAFWPGPLTVICRAQPSLTWDLGDTNGTVAIRMPLHPVALDLLSRTGPMAVSSANLSGRPAATTGEEAQEQLGDSVSVYLDSGPSEHGQASSIVDATAGVLRVVRLGALGEEEMRRAVPDGWLEPEDVDPEREAAQDAGEAAEEAAEENAG